MIEIHHSIPLAIGGTDQEENKIPLEKNSHKLVHSILNIPYTHIRSYRKLLNGVVLLNEEIFEQERSMQLKYFDNIGELSKDSFKEHYRAICTQANEEVRGIITKKIGKEGIVSSINKMIDLKIEEAEAIRNILNDKIGQQTDMDHRATEAGSTNYSLGY